ncbi:MAG: septation protein A [Mariprofundus sp.]|nr:septation protein A [Mariprofundus sp.]
MTQQSLASRAWYGVIRHMKMLFDFFPVLLFFIVYKTVDIYAATAVLIAASALQTFAHRIFKGSFEKSHVITLVLVALFGSLTLIFHDEVFIKWKPTAINWLFALVFVGSHFIGKKTIIERMMGANLTLPAFIWRRLSIAWALFFILLGALNLYVAFTFDTDTWVNFKLFGLMGLTFVFIIAQSLFLIPYLKTEESLK